MCQEAYGVATHSGAIDPSNPRNDRPAAREQDTRRSSRVIDLATERSRRSSESRRAGNYSGRYVTDWRFAAVDGSTRIRNSPGGCVVLMPSILKKALFLLTGGKCVA